MLPLESTHSTQSTSTLPPLPPAHGSFREHFSHGLRVASDMAGAAASLIPGAGLVSLALGGIAKLVGPHQAGNSGADRSGSQATSPELEQLLRGSHGMNMRYLALQASMAREARVYTALSNIMRVRHESAQNAISNIR